MAAPVFGSAGTFLDGASGSSAVVARPANLAVGDVILVHIYKENSEALTQPAGQGFGQVCVASVSTGSWPHYQFVVWKQATQADTTAASFTFSWTTAVWRAGVATRYTGSTAAGVTPIDVYATSARDTAGGTTPPVSVTSTGPDRLLVFSGATWDPGTWSTPTASGGVQAQTFTTQVASPASRILTVATATQATQGASGSVTATCSVTTRSQSGTLVALLPAGTIVPTITDSGSGTDTPTVAKTDLTSVTDSGPGADALTVFTDRAPLTDSGPTVETITVAQLTDVVVTDSGPGVDTVARADFLDKPLTEAAPSADSVTTVQTNFVALTESAPGVDNLLLLQTRDLTDSGPGVDVLAGGGAANLTDSGVGLDAVAVTDIPYTQVLPLRKVTVYDVVVVARIPQASGPPTYIEIDPIEWKSLTYTNTLSQAQQLTTSCLISSVTESVLQRLRRLHELATEIWLYRDGQIVFAGPLQGFQTSGEALTFKAQGLQSYLHMMVVNADTTFTNADQSAIVKGLVDQWQALDFGNFGIDTSNVTASGQLRTENYLRNELHVVGKLVEDLGKLAGGFDVEVDPASRRLQLWSPIKGVDRSSGEDAIVLDARNITSGDIICSVAPGDLASEAYGTGHASGAGASLFSVQANLELRSRYGRSAVTATWSDASQQSTLDNYVRGLLDARGEALLVPGPKVRATPDANIGDYGVGDKIAYELGSQLGISGAFRIRKQTVTASKSGQESVDLEFV